MTDSEITLDAWKSGFSQIAMWAVAIENVYTRLDRPEISFEAVLGTLPNPLENDDLPHPAAVEAFLEMTKILMNARRDYALEKMEEFQAELNVMSDVGFEEMRRYMEGEDGDPTED